MASPAGSRHLGLALAPRNPIYLHALSGGVTTALTMGAGATVLALAVTITLIRVRREDVADRVTT
jgi:hypothetical protein